MPFNDDDRKRAIRTEIKTDNLADAFAAFKTDHETRMRVVENRQLKSIGANSVISFLIAGFTTWVLGLSK